MAENLPEDILHFLNTRIDSIEQLQVLLLLHSNPQRTWTIAEISYEIRSVETSIAKRLNDLYERKVLVKMNETDDLHTFSPFSSDISTLIQSLAEENRRRPYRIIEAIYSRPAKSILEFAAAFKLRGDQ